MKAKTTKRALLTAILCLMLCVAMLIGTTYAWFTDSVTTGVNNITSGTLGIDIQDASGNSLTTLSFVKAAGHENEAILWEPGARYELEPFYIVNTGNLTLKYNVEVTGAIGDTELLDVIDFTIGNQSMEDYFAAKDVVLAPKGETGDKIGPITVKGVMDTAAGNAYQGLTVSGIKLSVYATQKDAETDSIDNTYDKDAVYSETVAPDLNKDLDGNYIATSMEGLANAAEVVTADTDAVTLMTNGGKVEVPVVNPSTTDLTAAALNSDSNMIIATAGTYNVASSGTSEEITIIGTEDTVLDMSNGTYLENADVAMQGVTIKLGLNKVNGGTGSDYTALYTKNPTFVDCKFIGGLRVGRDGAEFINCTFDLTTSAYDYVYHYGNSVSFKDCTFNTLGKAICLYSDGNGVTPEVSVTGCTFNATQAGFAGAITNKACAAIEIDNYGSGVKLTTAGNTWSPFFTGEWRIKTYYTGREAIFVNGVEYTSTAIDGTSFTVTGGVADY